MESIIYFLESILYIASGVIGMIGKPEWFGTRRFGWGVSVRTNEGRAYVLVIGLLVAFLWASKLEPALKGGLLAGLFALIVLDILSVMRQVYSGLDEREQTHQLIAERNASFVGVAGLAALVVYLAFTLPAQEIVRQLPPVAAIVVAMALAKGVTLLYLEREK